MLSTSTLKPVPLEVNEAVVCVEPLTDNPSIEEVPINIPLNVVSIVTPVSVLVTVTPKAPGVVVVNEAV